MNLRERRRCRTSIRNRLAQKAALSRLGLAKRAAVVMAMAMQEERAGWPRRRQVGLITTIIGRAASRSAWRKPAAAAAVRMPVLVRGQSRAAVQQAVRSAAVVATTDADWLCKRHVKAVSPSVKWAAVADTGGRGWAADSAERGER